MYPIDEILASELKIDLKNIHFEMAPIGSPAYEVIATGPRRRAAASAAHSIRRSSSGRSSIAFPTTSTCGSRPAGSKRAVGGKTTIDERIATDPERFWDRFQSKTLPALYDHVMALGNGKPRAEDAPFFGELTVDLTLSEPEYRLPVDQEQISSMEALHEEIYFNTHPLLRRDGPLHARRRARVSRAGHPGDASEGRRQSLATRRFPSPVSTPPDRPSSSSTSSATDTAARSNSTFPKIAVDRPQTLAAAVRAGRDGIERLDLRVKVDTEKDERDALDQAHGRRARRSHDAVGASRRPR